MIKVEKLRWKIFHKIVWKSDYVLCERFLTINGECSTSLRKTALTNLTLFFCYGDIQFLSIVHSEVCKYSANST